MPDMMVEEAGHGGQVLGHAGGGGVRAVHGAESVGDVDLSHGGQLLGERRVVLLLFGMEADVLQQHGLAGLDLGGQLLGVRANDVLGQLHLKAQLLGKALGHGREGILHVELALGTAQMRAEDDGGAMLEQVFDRRKRGVDARFVGDVLVLVQGHVEVAANQYFLAGNVDVLDRLFVEAHGDLSSLYNIQGYRLILPHLRED